MQPTHGPQDGPEGTATVEHSRVDRPAASPRLLFPENSTCLGASRWRLPGNQGK